MISRQSIKDKAELHKSLMQNPSKALWRLSVPIMGGMSIHTLYNFVDMIFIGRVSADALTAVAFNMPLFFLVLAIMMGIGSGVTSVIARYIGAGDKPNADDTAIHAFFTGLIISVAFSFTGLILGPQLLRFIGTPEHLNDLTWSYFQVLSLGVPFIVLSNIFGAILAGESDTKFPMKMIGLGTVLNIFLDPLFIFVLGMGLRGAAVATLISQSIVFTLFCYMLFIKKSSFLNFNFRTFKLHLKILSDIFSIGLPACTSLIIMAFGGMMFNKILVYHSHSAVAAYQIVGRIDMFVYLPIMSISSALVTLVGMFHGAKEIDKIKMIIKYAMTRSLLIEIAGACFIYTFAPHIISIFTDDLYIEVTAVKYLRTISLFYPLVAIAMTSGRSLQGLGKGLPMLVITSTRIVLVALPLSLFFTFVLHKPVEWVWYSMALSILVASIIGLSWVRAAVRQVVY